MNRSDFLNQISEVKQMIQNIGGTIESELVAEPASKSDAQELERAYQIQLPDDFAYYLTNVSAEVDVQWSFDRELRLTVMKSLPTFLNRFNAIYSGSLGWSLKKLASDIDYFRRFNPNGIVLRENNVVTEEDAFVGTLAICEIPCGDEIRINLAAPSKEKPIFYLNHSDPDESFVQLAPSFDAYVTQLLGISLVGSEIEQQLAFIPDRSIGIDCESKNALLWMNYLKQRM